jgi:hypothetical protein
VQPVWPGPGSELFHRLGSDWRAYSYPGGKKGLFREVVDYHLVCGAGLVVIELCRCQLTQAPYGSAFRL